MPSSKPMGTSSPLLRSGLVEEDDMRRGGGMDVAAGGVALGPELCSEPMGVDDAPAELLDKCVADVGVPLAPVMLPALCQVRTEGDAAVV